MARFNGHPINFRCRCGRAFSKTVGWIKANCMLHCDCGQRFVYDRRILPRDLGITERGVQSFIAKLARQPIAPGLKVEP